jgi:lipopolysaccharide transport system ATP-binding protein
VIDTVIRVEHLAKRYRLGARRGAAQLMLRDTLTRLVSTAWSGRGPKPPDATEFWALDDVSFEIARGEVVGIIGGNGAGKSTLLKILSRITVPTRGRARIVGRVGSLLEVGTGFHPELSGRENIYLNGAILGMTRSEIEQKFDQIVAFAEVERFIDMAVKYYSSGMFVRLAFAVAAHLEPEILIVDEVLSVGDMGFQQKCLGKMDDVARSGRTVLFVSHNMAAIQRLATSAILLDHGRLIGNGPVRTIVARYLGAHSYARYHADPRTGRPQLLDAHVVDDRGQPVARPLNTDAFGFRIRFVLPETRSGVKISLAILSGDGTVVFTSRTDDVSIAIPAGAGEYEVCVMLPADTLLAGDYHLAVYVWDAGEMFDRQEPALSFSVEHGPSVLYANGGREGLVHVRCRWTLEPATMPPSLPDSAYGAPLARSES